MCTGNSPAAGLSLPGTTAATPGETVAPDSPQPMTPNPAPTADPRNFSSKYNTVLNPMEEAKFQQWAEKNPRQASVYDYDSRGAWKELNSGTMKADERGHLGDKYKKPNHPTFSDQSTYHGVDGNAGGKWGKEGGKFTFTPSSSNMLSADELQSYFKKYEKGVKLKR